MNYSALSRYIKVPLRPVKRLFNNCLKSVMSLWRTYRIKSIDSAEFVDAHILVVKKREYVKLSHLCVESFLYFNRNAIVTLHVDSLTAPHIQKFFGSLIRKRRVRVIDVSNPEAKWQIQKLELICSLSGTRSIFMDADLKWNAPMPGLTGTTFFVCEFLLDTHDDYKYLLHNFLNGRSELGSMKNTSFFSWGGFRLSQGQENRIFEIENKIVHSTKSDSIDFRDPGIERMSEQIALSLAVEEFSDLEVNYLKEQDGFKDGSFVESSYFGATGASF